MRRTALPLDFIRGVPRALIRGPLARIAARLPTLVPPPEFDCRIEALPEGSATIDNSLYHEEAHAATWHSEDSSRELATLQLLNAARVPYFDRVWRQQLQLSPAREGTFLEVGCGGGIATSALATLGYQMTGVEPAVASLDAARRHTQHLGLSERVSFVQGDAYDLSMFPEASFDGVVMADVLEHLYDLPAAVAQAWRVLRPGGVLVFDTINRTFASYVLAIALAQEGLRIVPPHTHDWRMFVQPHELTILLQASGFLIDTSHFRGMAPTLSFRRPLNGLVGLASALRAGEPPPLPISDFVEVESLEVNYLGWALKLADGHRSGEPSVHARTTSAKGRGEGLSPPFAAGELAARLAGGRGKDVCRVRRTPDE
jgi:2-polyprenyl-6-hydroxyphenyl methylase/3-demethylubiquinone-9 3-methyltransferase